MEIYVVQYGDTVDAIADFYKVPVSTVIYDNQLIFPYRLATGQAILMRDGKTRIKREILASGYAYPFISEWTLEQTLPYLSEIYIFSYSFTSQGSLVPPQGDDSWIIKRALIYDVLPSLTLTPMEPGGHFNNQLITDLVHNPVAKNQLYQQLARTMKQKGYRGINVDFEYVTVQDRDAFSAFVKELTELMNPLGYQVSVALAPKIADDQPGILYEGMDYEALGKAANYVFLMTYEWGYKYGEPMAVAPIDKVRKVVEYAVSQIPPDKIVMGIPNYGYDWPLPFEPGITRARTVGNVEAIQQAIDLGVKVDYDLKSETPNYHYTSEGVEHVVWFEDVRSIRSKFRLIEEFKLLGGGYWHLMQYFRANWLLLDDWFEVMQKK